MGLINWIFDFYQQNRIDQLREEAAYYRTQAAAVRKRTGELDMEHLEQALGELALSVKAIQRTLVQKGLCTREDLRRQLQTADLEEGNAEGGRDLPRR